MNESSQNNEQPVVKQGRYTYVWMGLGALFLGYVLIKGITLPKAFIVVGAIVGGAYLLSKGMKNPALITYALVAYLPFSRQMQGDFDGLLMAFNFTNMLMFFICIVWFSGKYAEGEKLWYGTPLNLPIYLFLILGCISVVRGSYYGGDHLVAAVIEYKRWITPILMFFLVLNTVKSKDMIRTVVFIIMIVTTIVALMAIYDYIENGDMGSLEKSRIGGISEQPNQLASFFNNYMFMHFGFFLVYMSNMRAWGLLVPFLLCFRGIMVTFSRGGYISFAVSMFAIIFLRSKALFILLLFIAGLVYTNPDLLPAGIRYRLGQTFVGSADKSYSSILDAPEANLESSSRRRVEVWKAAFVMIKEQPVFGIGYGLFADMIKYYWDGGKMDAHNSYIIIAAEMGVPALLVFLWIVIAVFSATYALYLRTDDKFTKAVALGFLGGLFGLLSSNMFGSRLDAQEVSSYFWILAALVMRLRILHDKGALADDAQGTPQPVRRQTLDACWFDDQKANG